MAVCNHDTVCTCPPPYGLGNDPRAIGGTHLPVRATGGPVKDHGRLPVEVTACVRDARRAVDSLAAFLKPTLRELTAEQVDTLVADVLEVAAIARHLGAEVQAERDERDRLARQVVASLTRQAGA